jgi:magnesium-transporting ATPase (P-type)
MDSRRGQENKVMMIKADKRIRTLIILAYIAAILVMVVLLVWILPWGEGKLEQTEPEVMLRVIRIVIAFIFLSIVPFGLYMCQFGWRVIKHKKIPPPGTKVIVDTKALEGEKAVTRGKIIIAVSLVLVVVGLYGGLYFPYKLEKVFGEQINQPIPEAVSVN